MNDWHLYYSRNRDNIVDVDCFVAENLVGIVERIARHHCGS